MTNDQIKYGLENEKLKLSVRENITHYEIVGFCYFLPLIIGIFFLRDYLRGMPQRPKTEGVASI